ncbi:hypothetical protein AB0G87_37440 [Streptomyces asoensis]|uniref:hypothetical protein n=1 Tax=Streptomyces asoensis TaxID=249586 RepID=UPI003406F3B3
MSEGSDAGPGKELEVRGVGRPPQLDGSAPSQSQELAVLLRRLMFDPLKGHGYGFREIGGALGAGYSTATVSRISRATKVPTFVELDQLMKFTAEVTGTQFGLEEQMTVRAAHLAALKATRSSLYELFMAEQACQAYRLECERAGHIQQELRAELVLAHRLLHRARQREAAERASAAREQQEGERTAVRLEQTRAALEEAQTSAVLEVAARRAEIMSVRQALAQAQALNRQAELRLAGARRELAEAQEQLQVEVAGGQAVAQELAVVTATLQQVRAERDALREEEARRAVLDEAGAAVHRAQREMSGEEVLVGAVPGQGGGQPEDAGVSDDVLRAALFGSEEELADLLADLGDRGDSQMLALILDTAASRPAVEICALLQALGEAGYWQYKEQLLRAAAEQPAASVVELLRALERSEALTDIGLVFDAAAVGDVGTLVRYLLQQDLRVYAARLLDAAVRRRPVKDVVALLTVLEADGRRNEADGVVRDAATHRSPRDVLTLLGQLEELPEAIHYVDVTLGAAAFRKPQAIAALHRHLADAGKSDLAAMLLDHASRWQEVAGVAETVALLVADAAEGAGLRQVVEPFVHHRGELLWQLLTHLVPWSHGAVAEVLRLLGQTLPADGLVPLALRTAEFLPALALDEGAPPRDGADILLGQAATRDSTHIADLVRLLGETSPDTAEALIKHALKQPPADAARTVSVLLSTGTDAQALTRLAIAAVPSLTALLALADALEPTAHRRLRHRLVKSAGACPAFSAASVADALRLRHPGWMAQALLEGVAQRHEDLVAEQMLELHQHGPHPYAQLLLLVTVALPGALARTAAALWEHGLSEDALWLWTRHAETSPADELASTIGQSPAGCIPELIRCCVHTITPGQAAELISALVNRANEHLALNVLSEAATAAPDWILACAAALESKGRTWQAAWLRQRAHSPADAPAWPPPENAAEAASATSHLYNMGHSAQADEMLTQLLDLSMAKSTATSVPAYDLLQLLNDVPARAQQRLLKGIVDLPDLVGTATPAYISHLLQFLTESPALRARLFALPAHDQSGHVQALLAAMDTLDPKDPIREEILDVSISLHDMVELTGIARRVLADGREPTARLLIWHALRRRPVNDLAPLVRLAVTHNLANRQELHKLLHQSRRGTDDEILTCMDEAFRPEFHLQVPRRGSGSALVIPPHLHEMIALHAAQFDPACGVIVGPRTSQRLTNCYSLNPAPKLPVLSGKPRPVADVGYLLRDGEEIKAVYYCVPASIPYPSPADIARVTPTAKHYLIITTAHTHTAPGPANTIDTLRAFTLHRNTIHERRVLVAPDDTPPFTA